MTQSNLDTLISVGTEAYNMTMTTPFSTLNETTLSGAEIDDDGCPDMNCTAWEYAQFILGPQMLPLHKAILTSIIFGVIFITGVLGNVLVCMVIIRQSTMHTATNYYLFSLAVSDLLYLLLGLPTEVFQYWHQYPYLFGLTFCRLRAFISEACTYVSVLTIVAFSMERFLAICHPLYLYTMAGFKRALKIIIVLWILSFLSAIPYGVNTRIEYLYYPVDNSRIWDSAYCLIPLDFPAKYPLFEVSFSVSFIIPMIIIILLYGRMGAQIRARATEKLGVQQGSKNRETRYSQRKKKALIRMLAAVVLTFFICWLPFHLQRLWIIYAKNSVYYQIINEWLYSVGGFAYYISCTINPIVYNVMSHRYRTAFKEILCCKKVDSYYKNGYLIERSSLRYQSSFRRSSSANNRRSSRIQSKEMTNFTIKSLKSCDIVDQTVQASIEMP